MFPIVPLKSPLPTVSSTVPGPISSNWPEPDRLVSKFRVPPSGEIGTGSYRNRRSENAVARDYTSVDYDIWTLGGCCQGTTRIVPLLVTVTSPETPGTADCRTVADIGRAHDRAVVDQQSVRRFSEKPWLALSALSVPPGLIVIKPPVCQIAVEVIQQAAAGNGDRPRHCSIPRRCWCRSARAGRDRRLPTIHASPPLPVIRPLLVTLMSIVGPFCWTTTPLLMVTL